jgi:nucleoside-diphosphate-sugar epimerase
MNCLLTGANGFLGRALLPDLVYNYDVKTLSKSTEDYKTRLDVFIPTFNETFKLSFMQLVLHMVPH